MNSHDKEASAFAIVHEKLKAQNPAKKEKKKRSNQVVFPTGSKNVYIKFYDKNLYNKKGGKGKYVVLAKIPLDTYPIPNFHQFLDRYTTDTYQNSDYEILESEYRKIKKHIELYSREMLKISFPNYNKKEIVFINNNPYEVSELAVPIHQLCDIIDTLEYITDKQQAAISVKDAQDLLQATQRLTTRLNAAHTPITNFYEHIYKKDDESVLTDMRRKYGASAQSDMTFKRYLECFDALTPLSPKGHQRKKNAAADKFWKWFNGILNLKVVKNQNHHDT